MLKELKCHIESKFPELFKEKVFLAISGGKDSVALCHLLMKIGIQPELLHCNFQLRGTESDEDELFVRQLSAQLKLVIHVKTFDMNLERKSSGLNIQILARQLRYNWFQKFIENEPNCKILTAHHALDNVETILLNLSRGTGINGLTGIPEQNKNFIRPLIPFSQNDILTFIRNEKIQFRDDSSNFEKKYARNKIRHDVLPVLRDIGDQLEHKFSKTIHELKSVNNWISAEVEKYMLKNVKKSRDKFHFKLNSLNEVHSFFLFKIFEPFQINRKKYNEFVKFLSSKTGSLFLSQDYEFLIDREELIIRNKVHFDYSNQTIKTLPFKFGRYELKSIRNSELDEHNYDFIISENELVFPLILRKPEKGERIKLRNQPNKLISDILVNKKINRFDKEEAVILEDGNKRALALLPIQVCDATSANSKSEKIIAISVY